MIILGLGSNLGDRLEHLRQAFLALKRLHSLTIQQVSPVYISDALVPENAPADWDKPYLNFALRCETHLAPQDLLRELKNIEWSIGRKPEKRHWGPRVIDIDILAYDNLVIQNEIITLPHAGLTERPFALWPLADVAPLWVYPSQGLYHGKTAAEMAEVFGSRFSGEAPFRTRQINQRAETSQFMGIINATPDSYSDGGQFIQPEAAVKQMFHLVESGAEIIDIGAESTSPVATPVTAKEEWQRLQPVLEAIKAEQQRCLITPKISIDTRHGEVAEKAIARGVDWINDVSGLDHALMRDIVIHSGLDCVVMHHLSIPASRFHVLPRSQDPVKAVYAWAEQRLDELEQQGLNREKIIFDPGIGFGKTPEQSLLLLQHAKLFKSLGTRLLFGHSRKSFLSLLTNKPFAERDAETMAIAIQLVKDGIDYIRVHNVDMCMRGLKATCAVEFN